MSSGIAVSDECIDRYSEFKDEHKYKFVIYRIGEDLKSIIVESTSEDAITDESGNPKEEPSDVYEKFISRFPENDGRYAVYDFDYTHDGGKRNKVLFFSWAPDTAPIKSKMLYASSKNDIEKRLDAISLVIQATEKSNLFYDEVLEKVNSRFR
ncbi:cofilin [Coemansia sp. RSA 2559]|nr:cofilin [Coemansia sp. RSA 2559]